MTKTLAAVTALMGTIVGAGFLALPYAISQAGFALGMVYLFVIGLIMCCIMVYLGEVILRTKEPHQLTGYAEKYLGKTGKKWMLASLTIGIYLALIAYMIAEGNSLSQLIFGTPAYAFQIGIIFWLVLSALTYYGTNALERGEMVSATLVTLLLLSAVILVASKINPANYTLANPSLKLPFGVIIFAYLGFSILPEVARILGDKKKLLKRTIITAYSCVFLIYAIFTTLVIGYQGASTPEIATFALGRPFILIGIVTMFGAYLALANAMRGIYRLDLRKSKIKSWLIVTLVPILAYIALYWAKLTNFVNILSIGGIIAGTINITMICLMINKAKTYGDRHPEYSMPYNKKLIILLLIFLVASATIEIFSKFS